MAKLPLVTELSDDALSALVLKYANSQKFLIGQSFVYNPHAASELLFDMMMDPRTDNIILNKKTMHIVDHSRDLASRPESRHVSHVRRVAECYAVLNGLAYCIPLL